MAFNYDITTDRGKVRLLIGDTVDAGHQFEDAEIDAFLLMASGSLLTAAGYALEAWAASITGGLTSEKIGDYAYTKKDAENKLKLAMEYKKQDAEKPYLTWAEMDLSGVEDTDEDIE